MQLKNSPLFEIYFLIIGLLIDLCIYHVKDEIIYSFSILLYALAYHAQIMFTNFNCANDVGHVP